MTKPWYESYTDPTGSTSWERWRSFSASSSLKPLPYRAVFRTSSDGAASYTNDPYYGDSEATRKAAYNAAYAAFVSRTKDKVNMALNLAELGQSYKLVADTLIGVGKVVKGLKTASWSRVKDGLQHLGAAPASARDFCNDFSRNWLAYQYAVRPAISDATKIINDKILLPYGQTHRIIGKATRSVNIGYPVNDYTRYDQIHPWSYRLQADVTLDNPSLYKASQTGLTNPFALAYELIPFSFVVDWFVNVGDIINSIDDFAGVRLDNTATSELFRGSHVMTAVYRNQGVTIRSYSTVTRFSRSVGPFSGPRLALNFPIQSPTRLLNALALAIPSILHK